MLNQTRALWGIARESPLQGPGISYREPVMAVVVSAKDAQKGESIRVDCRKRVDLFERVHDQVATSRNEVAALLLVSPRRGRETRYFLDRQRINAGLLISGLHHVDQGL